MLISAYISMLGSFMSNVAWAHFEIIDHPYEVHVHLCPDSLLAARCSLLSAYFSLLTGPCSPVAPYCSLLLTGRCLTGHWSLVTAHCPLTAYCPLPTAHCLLPTAYCPLPTAYNSPPTHNPSYFTTQPLLLHNTTPLTLPLLLLYHSSYFTTPFTGTLLHCGRRQHERPEPALSGQHGAAGGCPKRDRSKPRVASSGW